MFWYSHRSRDCIVFHTLLNREPPPRNSPRKQTVQGFLLSTRVTTYYLNYIVANEQSFKQQLSLHSPLFNVNLYTKATVLRERRISEPKAFSPTGWLGSEEEEQRAEELARRTPGSSGCYDGMDASKGRVPDRQAPHCSPHTEGH